MRQRTDPMMLAGLGIVLVTIVLAMVIDGNSFAPLIGPSSFLLVFFGTLGAGVMAYRKSELTRIPAAAKAALNGAPPDTDQSITTLASLAETGRREGMLALEGRLADVDDDAIRAGLQLLVDGSDEEQVRQLLEIDIAAIDERHQLGISFFKSLGGYSPTFGMLGTVIGLINMLQNLTDPAQLGIGMALALLTTLYGVLFANILWIPLATRLDRLNELEILGRKIVLDGVLCIQAGMSPRLLVERLEIHLPAALRVGYKTRLAAASEAPSPAATVSEAA